MRVFLLLMCLPGVVWAGVYRCKVDGKTVYQAKPCPVGSVSESQVKTYKAPKSAVKAVGFRRYRSGDNFEYNKLRTTNRRKNVDSRKQDRAKLVSDYHRYTTSTIIEHNDGVTRIYED